ARKRQMRWLASHRPGAGPGVVESQLDHRAEQMRRQGNRRLVVRADMQAPDAINAAQQRGEHRKLALQKELQRAAGVTAGNIRRHAGLSSCDGARIVRESTAKVKRLLRRTTVPGCSGR